MRFSTIERLADLFRGPLPGVDRKMLLVQAHAASGAGEQLAKWWLSEYSLRCSQLFDEMLRHPWSGTRSLSRKRIR